METPNHEPQQIHQRAPAIIKLGSSLISVSDYGDRETRNLLEMKGFKEDAINQIMASKLIARLEHRYDSEDIEGGDEQDSDHTAGVTLLLLLELSETDTDVLAAAESHNVLSRSVFSEREMKNLIGKAISPESLRIIQIVTKTKENGDIYYDLIFQDKKAAKLKVANRMYNLRCLDIFHVVESNLTREHLKKAEEYTQETREFMLPIAKEHNLRTHLLDEIEKAEKRISEIDLILTQRETEEAVKITLIS